MQPVLFDSSIYITALRTGDEAALALRRLAANAPVWLSSVVLEELYAGAAPRGRHVLERLELILRRPGGSWCQISTTGPRPAKCWPDWPPSMITSTLNRAG